MFGSLEGGFIPICVVAALVAFALASMPRLWHALFLTAIAAIAISYAWYWLPALWSTRGHPEPQGGWDLIATAAWSAVAVPVSVVTMFVARRIKASRRRAR